MHPDLAPLLVFAKQHPEDDVARLVIADWLEEHGDENERARAQLIRYQVELARGTADHFRSLYLYTEIEEVRSCHQADWLGRLGQSPGVRGAACVRGFLRLRVSEKSFFFAHELFTECPEWPWVDGLVHVGDGLPDHDVETRLPESGLLSGLHSLELRRVWLSPSAWRRLFLNEALADLRELDLRGSSLDSEAVTVLASSARLPKIQRLWINATYLSPEAKAAMTDRFGDRVRL